MDKILKIDPEDKTFLERLYYKPDFPGSYSSPINFYKAVKQTFPEKVFPRGVITNFVKSLNVYNTNRSYKRIFPRPKIICTYVNYIGFMDLISYVNRASSNRKYKYILVIIDCLSKYVKAHALLNKKPQSVINALKKMYPDKDYPYALSSDRGSEFTATICRNFYKNNGIHYFTSKNEVKSPIVERFILTLRRKIERNFKKIGKFNWISYYKNFVKGYNNSYHRAIKMKPVNVSKENQIQAFDNLMRNDLPQSMNSVKYKFKIGQAVKILDKAEKFDRAYTPKWTSEFFYIHNRYLKQNIPMYTLIDQNNEIIKGSFYTNEIFKVPLQENDEFHIEKILKRKRIRGVPHVYIKWMGYPKKFNSWIPASEVKSLK